MLKAQLELNKFRWLFILLVPVFAISLNLVFFGTLYFREWNILLFSTLLMLAGTLLLSSVQIGIAAYMRRKQNGERGIFLRLFLATLIHFPVTALFVGGFYLLYGRYKLFHYVPHSNDLYRGILCGVVCDLIGIAMNEGIYSYHKWRETKLEAEQLSKEMLQTQLNSLLQQINPHFLFNSLNSLSALINENTTDAQKYLLDLSKVYRYLLRTNQDELATLSAELSFIDSYFNLLQTRFGQGVELLKNVRPEDYGMLLPPLTLQLLLENAVKHNMVGKNKPLRIEISSADGAIVVKNNLQRRSMKVESGRVGLSNIAEKYRLINKSTIEIIEDNDTFSVKVPLIFSGDRN